MSETEEGNKTKVHYRQQLKPTQKLQEARVRDGGGANNANGKSEDAQKNPSSLSETSSNGASQNTLLTRLRKARETRKTPIPTAHYVVEASQKAAIANNEKQLRERTLAQKAADWIKENW